MERFLPSFVEIDRYGRLVLERDECLLLLATHRLGRVAVSLGALPTVLPVNFRLVGDRIVFRAAVDPRLEAAMRDAVVAFEVDEIDEIDHTGWSVVVTGIARAVSDPAGDVRTVEVSTDLVTGQRLIAAQLQEGQL